MTFYPSVDGIPVSIDKIKLPVSKLDVDNPENFNVHHEYWPRRVFGEYMLYRTLRDLTSKQILVEEDVHNYLHANYHPPELPTPTQALLEIVRAAKAGEKLYDRHSSKDIYRDISRDVIKKVLESYYELEKKQNHRMIEALPPGVEDILAELDLQDVI